MEKNVDIKHFIIIMKGKSLYDSLFLAAVKGKCSIVILHSYCHSLPRKPQVIFLNSKVSESLCP